MNGDGVTNVIRMTTMMMVKMMAMAMATTNVIMITSDNDHIINA